MNLSPGTIVALVVPLAFLGFAAFWCLICFIIAQSGGWNTLATQFPAGAQKPYGVQWFQWQSMELGASEYRGTVNFGVAPDGLYLSVVALFGVGHAPILIPWSAITGSNTGKRWWSTYHALIVPLENQTAATITLYNAGLASAIAPHLTPVGGPMR